MTTFTDIAIWVGTFFIIFVIMTILMRSVFDGFLVGVVLTLTILGVPPAQEFRLLMREVLSYPLGIVALILFVYFLKKTPS